MANEETFPITVCVDEPAGDAAGAVATDVATGADGPEIRVSGAIQPVLPQSWLNRIHVQVEYRDLGSLLLVARELRKAVFEGVGDAEVHITRKLIGLLRGWNRN